MAGRSIYPTEVERAAGRVEGVRPRVCGGGAPGTRANRSPVGVESSNWQDAAEVRRVQHRVAHEVMADVDMRPGRVVVLGPGAIPKTPSGKLRRAHSVSLISSSERAPSSQPGG